MLAGWNDGEIRDIHQEMMQLTLRIVARVLFSVEVKEETRKSIAALEPADEAHLGLAHDIASAHALLADSCLWRGCGAQCGSWTRSSTASFAAAGQLPAVEIRPRGDLLSMLMSAQDEDGSRMTDRQLRDEIMTFLLAGHETTAVSLSWTWYLLSENPEVEEKLQAELHAILHGRTPSTARLAASRLMPAEWSRNPCACTRRPGAWPRAAAQDCEIGGYRLPAGCQRGHEPVDHAPRSAILSRS